MLPKIERILYATAIGPGAPYVFRYALSLARKHDAEIVAVHGMEPLSTFGQSLVELHISHEDSEQMHLQAREKVAGQLRERIREICDAENGGPEDCRVSDIRVIEGQPYQVVLEQAEELGADLIVMGSHRHSVLGDAMLGTTTHKVLHSSTIPVLVVRIPEGF